MNIISPVVAFRRRIAIIRNPVAGNRSATGFKAILDALEAEGCAVEVRETTRPNGAQEMAAAISARDFDLVAAAGGDGTINEVADGLGDQAPPLAIIPAGTTNVLALEVGIPKDPSVIARIMTRGPARRIHPGLANGRQFLMMAGAGFDAHVVAATNSALKKKIGQRAYVWNGFKCFVQGRRADYRVTIDGKPFSAAAVTVANMRYYGGPNIMAPEASLETPGFHVCLFLKGGRYHVAKHGIALLAGKLPEMADVAIIPGNRITIEGDPSEPVQADGEIVGNLPVEIELAPKPQEILFPC
ncbi:MAG: diacylglycerol/lipid kinase family protein [Magnetovibrionaceae bacterium]